MLAQTSLLREAIPEFVNNPFYTQAMKPLPKKFSVQAWYNVWSNLHGLIGTIAGHGDSFFQLVGSGYNLLNAPEDHVFILILRAYLNYDKDQWKALPDANKKELLESVRLMFDIATAASPFPVTPRQAAEGIFFGKIIKVASLLKYTSLGRFATRTGVSIAEKESIQAIKTTLTRDIRFVQRRAKANKPKCVFGTFSVKSDCGDYVNPHVDIDDSFELTKTIKDNLDEYLINSSKATKKYTNIRRSSDTIERSTKVSVDKITKISKKFTGVTKEKYEKLVLSKIYKLKNERKIVRTNIDLPDDLTKNWVVHPTTNELVEDITNPKWTTQFNSDGQPWNGGGKYNKADPNFELDLYSIDTFDIGSMSRKEKNLYNGRKADASTYDLYAATGVSPKNRTDNLLEII